MPTQPVEFDWQAFFRRVQPEIRKAESQQRLRVLQASANARDVPVFPTAAGTMVRAPADRNVPILGQERLTGLLQLLGIAPGPPPGVNLDQLQMRDRTGQEGALGFGRSAKTSTGYD